MQDTTISLDEAREAGRIAAIMELWDGNNVSS